VFTLLVETGEQRLYIVDHDTKPISRVSLADLFEVVYKEHSNDVPYSATLNTTMEGDNDYAYM
jgi:hypothetical protein